MNNPSKSPGKAALSVWGQGNDCSWRLLSFAFSGYPVINSFKLSNNSRGWFLAHVRWICYINRSLPVSVQCTAPGSAFGGNSVPCFFFNLKSQAERAALIWCVNILQKKQKERWWAATTAIKPLAQKWSMSLSRTFHWQSKSGGQAWGCWLGKHKFPTEENSRYWKQCHSYHNHRPWTSGQWFLANA